MGSLSYKSDPGKINLYLACGLPVLTTKITTSGKVLVKYGAGIITEIDDKSLSKSVTYLLSNKERLIGYKNSAIKLFAMYDIDRLL